MTVYKTCLQYIHLKLAKGCTSVFTSVVCPVIVLDKLRPRDLQKSIFKTMTHWANVSTCTASSFLMSASTVQDLDIWKAWGAAPEDRDLETSCTNN